MTTPQIFTADRPRENVLRGALLALVAIPVGAVLWSIIWNLGFVASIVAFGVAFVAVLLYRAGSGGRVSVLGASIIAGVVLVALLVSFAAGLVTEFALAVAAETGLGMLQTFGLPDFWAVFREILPGALEANALNFGLAILFGLLGSFGILRSTFQEANAARRADAPRAPESFAPTPAPTADGWTQPPTAPVAPAAAPLFSAAAGAPVAAPVFSGASDAPAAAAPVFTTGSDAPGVATAPALFTAEPLTAEPLTAEPRDDRPSASS